MSTKVFKINVLVIGSYLLDPLKHPWYLSQGPTSTPWCFLVSWHVLHLGFVLHFYRWQFFCNSVLSYVRLWVRFCCTSCEHMTISLSSYEEIVSPIQIRGQDHEEAS